MGDVFVLAQIQKDLQMLLAPIFDTYQEYACSDGKNFAGNIGCVRINKDNTMEAVALEDWGEDRKTAKNKVFTKIDQKTDVDKQLEASAFGATLGAAQGYTLEKIKIAADNIDLAKSAVCTTFAVSGANKLLELQKSPEYKDKIKRVEIIAKKYGHRGTHCYVVINRKEGSDLNDPNTWGSDALVVDPWLSSLQNPSVYKPEEYALSGFLYGKLQCNFDSTNPNLRKEKKLKIALKQEMKEAYISHIKEGNLDKILEAMILYGHKVETVKLGKGFENLFTQAIKYKQTELFKNLWKKLKILRLLKTEDPRY